MTIGERIKAWDEAVEADGAPDELAREPFDAGIMLAVGDVLDAYAAVVRGEDKAPARLASRMHQLHDTAAMMIDASQEEVRT